jgi:hypothetical protein
VKHSGLFCFCLCLCTTKPKVSSYPHMLARLGGSISRRNAYELSRSTFNVEGWVDAVVHFASLVDQQVILDPDSRLGALSEGGCANAGCDHLHCPTLGNAAGDAGSQPYPWSHPFFLPRRSSRMIHFCSVRWCHLDCAISGGAVTW